MSLWSISPRDGKNRAKEIKAELIKRFQAQSGRYWQEKKRGVSTTQEKNYFSPMNTFKNYLIALLTGLLVLTITAQPSTGASKTYDAVKLAEYTACINAQMNLDITMFQVNGGNGSLKVGDNIKFCKILKPY